MIANWLWAAACLLLVTITLCLLWMRQVDARKLRGMERRLEGQRKRIDALAAEVAYYHGRATAAERDLDAERRLHAALEDAGVDVVAREMPVMNVWSRQN